MVTQFWSGNDIQTPPPTPPQQHPIRSLHFNFISLAKELVVNIHLLLMRDYKNQGKLISFDLVSKF